MVAGCGGDGVYGVREGARGEHGLKADEGDVRGDEENGGGEGDGGGGFESVAAAAQQPGGEGSDEEGDGGDEGGQAEGGKRRPGEIEKVRGGERVAADIAMSEQGPDVGDEGEMARGPETVCESSSDGDSDEGEGGVHAGEPFAGGVDPAGVAFGCVLNHGE